MPYYKFGPNDTFYNRIETHPQNEFFIWNGSVYYDYNPERIGVLSGQPENNVPTGNISLYELNVDRPSDALIYPFITKGGSLTSFKTISLKSFNADFQYGDIISGSYPLSATITRDWVAAGAATSSACSYNVCKKHLVALENTLNYYTYLSPHYAYTSSFGDKAAQEMGIIFIPSIFYGSHIEKGSISLKFYVTGTLIGELKDKDQNGNLVEVSGSNTGSVAGVVLYTEGVMLLTGSWALDTHTEIYTPGGTAQSSSWKYFGWTGSLGATTAPSSSFAMSFRGTNYVPVRTMFANAPKGRLNHSNNPTYIEYGQSGSTTAPKATKKGYMEDKNIDIKNTVSSSFPDPTAPFQKQTWISRIGIYDEDKNLIGIAKVANPVKKTEEREFTFKLKLDI